MRPGKDGLSADKIAKYCILSPRQVVASLAERRMDDALGDDTGELCAYRVAPREDEGPLCP